MNDLVKRLIEIEKGKSVVVDLNHPVVRDASNPILTAREVNKVWADPALQVKTVHNAGITQFDNDTLMLFRSHLRCGKSVLGLARSSNGMDDWRIDPHPSHLAPRRSSSSRS